VLEALVKLDMTWTVPALQEVAQWPSAPPEFRAKLTETVRALTAS
jgi:hypothetical protein